MKKNIITLLALTSSSLVFSQVGINTPTPTSTMDIAAKNATGKSNNIDGLLIPRVDRERAQSMTGIPVSNLIYVDNVTTGTLAGIAKYIDKNGYYYFDGSNWIKLTAAAGTDTSIYNQDGMILANRTVQTGPFQLNFETTKQSGINIKTLKGTAFSVDGMSNRVGMGTDAPYASLHVVAIEPKGTSAYPEGVIMPNVDRQRVQSMTSTSVSTMLYVDDITTGTQAGTARYIDEKGYYYFDGSVWQKLNTSKNLNLYNSDGALSENRTVTQNDKTLSFTGNAVNGFSVDGNTFSVNSADNRVGIGTASPLSVLSVVNPTAGNTIDAFSAGINNCGGACGQGTARNITLFNANGTNSLFAGIDFIPAITGNGISGASIQGIDRDRVNGYAGLQFSTRNASGFAPRLTIKSSGNIGIGTQTPTNLFHVESATNGAVKIVDGTQGVDKVLTSDANGVATWKSIPAFGSTNIYNSNGTLNGNRVVNQGSNTLAFNSTAANGFSVGGNNLSVDGTNNRVGIGTITPASKLHVDGGESRFSSGTSAWALSPTLGGTTGSSNSFEIVDRVKNIRRMIFNDNGDVTLGGGMSANNAAGVLSVRSGNSVGINTGAPASTLDIVGNTFGIRKASGSGSWDNIWLDVNNAFAPSINAAGAETGLQFKVGSNTVGTYGDTGQVLTTVATMTPKGNVGIGTETPATSAILDLTSTNKGFLPPRMTTVQRDALNPKPAGLMIYNTDLNCMQYWNTSQWKGDCSGTTTPGIVLSLTCASATNTGTLASGTIASNVASTIPYTGGNGGSHGGQAVSSTGVTGLTATLSAGSFVNGNGTLTYIITGVPSGIGTASFAINIGGKTCNLTRPVVAAAGIVSSLNCAGATNAGTLTGGTAASGVTSTISYTGGNAGSHSGQTVSSTGVTGLTATLSGGNFANGNGTLTYTITGTPSAAGTANFAINIGGQTCTLTRSVNAPVGSVSGINCAGAITTGTLLAGSAASGVVSTISYTGGNGGSHSGQTVISTGVAGLTATLTGGNFANGSGTLTYTITGTPTSAGPANFAINIGGKTCTLSVPVEVTTYVCKTEGLFPDPNDIMKYYRCIRIGGVMYQYFWTCAPGSHYDPIQQRCVID